MTYAEDRLRLHALDALLSFLLARFHLRLCFIQTPFELVDLG